MKHHTRFSFAVAVLAVSTGCLRNPPEKPQIPEIVIPEVPNVPVEEVAPPTNRRPNPRPTQACLIGLMLEDQPIGYVPLKQEGSDVELIQIMPGTEHYEAYHKILVEFGHWPEGGIDSLRTWCPYDEDRPSKPRTRQP